MTFHPFRSVFATAFVTVWFVGWTYASLAFAIHGPEDGPPWDATLVGVVSFLFGIGFAVLTLGSMWLGRTVVTGSPAGLETRTELWRFVRVRRFPAPLVEDVRPGELEDEDGPRGDFGLELVARGKATRVGEGMSREEADAAAGLLFAQVRPLPARASDDVYAASPAREPARAVARQRNDPVERASWRRAVLHLAVMALLIALAAETLGGGPPDRSSELPRREAGPPVRTSYGDVRDYAAAMTFFALRSAHVVAVERPSCGAQGERWECTVRARAESGPYAGRVAIYRCWESEHRQPGGRPAVRGVDCSPLRGAG